MSEFSVSRRKVREVWNHPNADVLDLCKIEGTEYQFIIKRDSIKVGDSVVYFPEDSLIPEEILDLVGLKGKLSGKGKNRCKAINLRGEVSQGLLIETYRISDFLGKDVPEEVDLASFLNVIKYEPPETFSGHATLTRLPNGVMEYDIENAENNSDIVDFLLDVPVVVTEKVEGTNISISIFRDGNIFVNSHRRNVVRDVISEKKNTYWSTVISLGLEEKLTSAARSLFKSSDQVTFYGELVGPSIEGNIYGLKHFDILFFDILIDKVFVNARDKFNHFESCRVKTVPVLADDCTLREYLDRCGNNDLRLISNGYSVVSDNRTLREGIIITPLTEIRNVGKLSRVILKQKDPIYLAKKK